MLNTAEEWPENPHLLFEDWMAEAVQEEVNNPNAMCLATVDENSRPSARMVLLKDHDERGFVFYTNEESRKGHDLSVNQHVALCFYWKSLNKQVRVEGTISYVSDEEADAYFQSRHPNSRIGAWASLQSRPLAHRDEFDTRLAEYQAKFKDETTIPRPSHWRGFRVEPTHIEFWIEELHRLHRRCVYTPDNKGYWNRQMLYP